MDFNVLVEQVIWGTNVKIIFANVDNDTQYNYECGHVVFTGADSCTPVVYPC